MNGLGLGPDGPPIPPPVVFSVIPYPVRRHSPFASDTSLHYMFVSPGSHDVNVSGDEKMRKPESDFDKNEKVRAMWCIHPVGLFVLFISLILFQ